MKEGWAGSGVGKHADEVGCFIPPPAPYFEAKDEQAASSVLQQFWMGSFLVAIGSRGAVLFHWSLSMHWDCFGATQLQRKNWSVACDRKKLTEHSCRVTI